jgi:hypothetical protein
MGLRSFLIRVLGGTNGNPAAPPPPVPVSPAAFPAGVFTLKMAEWKAPNGLVRAHYRTTYMASDEFSRTYLAMDLSEDGRSARMNTQELGRWCLEQFVVAVDTLENGAWVTRPFTWKLMDEMPREFAAGGWPAILALHIWSSVVQVEARNLESLDGTLLSATGPASPARNTTGGPSPSSTSSGPVA